MPSSLTLNRDRAHRIADSKTRIATVLSRRDRSTYLLEDVITKQEFWASSANPNDSFSPGTRVKVERHTIATGSNWVIISRAPEEQRGVATNARIARAEYSAAMIRSLSPSPVRLGIGDPTPQSLLIRGFNMSGTPTYELAEIVDDSAPVITAPLITCSLVANPGCAVGLWDLIVHGRTFDDAIETYEPPPIAWAAARSSVAITTDVIATSRDAATWSVIDAPAVASWQSMAYGNGMFVAVASGGTNRVMKSVDGVNWTSHAAAEANSWQSVAFGNGMFIAVAASGTNRVMKSTDGETWTPHAAPAARTWWAVAYGNGRFVAVAYNTNKAMVSTDGEAWSEYTMSISAQWTAIAYGGGRFVAVAQSASGATAWSTDGQSWSTSLPPVVESWQSIAYGGGRFVAVADADAGFSVTIYSTDGGSTWTDVSTAVAYAANWREVRYGDGLFVVVGVTDSASGVLITSPDGVTWSDVDGGLYGQHDALAFAG